MKKLLLGSTALVVGGLMAAPAMAADPIKIGVGGYYTFYAVAGGIQSTYATNGTVQSYNGLFFQQEGEIHFIGQTKLDNGTSVGLNVELEGWNPTSATANAQIDEAYLFAFGNWGRVEVGSRDAASYRMYYGSPSALIGYGAIQHNHNIVAASPNAFNKAFFHATTATNTAAWQDVNRINVFTPRFQGFQLGVGYAPKVNTGAGSSFGSTGLASGPGGGAGQCGYNNATNVNNCATNDYAWTNAFDIGANYLNKFGDVTVAAYGSWAYASFSPGYGAFGGNNVPGATNLTGTPSAASQTTGGNLAAWVMWAAGLQFGYKGITLGGSIGYDNGGMGANYFTGQDNATRFATAGIMYETGPWQVSFMWMGSINNNGNGSATIQNFAQGTGAVTTSAAGFTGTPGVNSTAFSGPNALAFGAETAQKFELGANYALGPGVKVTGGGILQTQSGPSNAVTGQSWSLLLGMDLRF